MRQKMQYYIISGKVIEERRCYMPVQKEHRIRGQRKAGSTSLRKIQLNERESVARLARTLNTNFVDGLMHVVLKYDQERLPENYEQLEKNMTKFLRSARKAYKNLHGEELRYVAVNANWSPSKNRPARFHHHLVLPVTSMDVIAELWPHGQFYIRRVNTPGDLTTLAAYLIANVSGLEPGKKAYSTSKNMLKPLFTEPKPVDDIDSIEPLPNTSILDARQTVDEDGYTCGSYMRCITMEPVKVRGGMIILPKKKSKKNVPASISMEAIQNDDE